MNKQELIDKAVEDLDGELPSPLYKKTSNANGWYLSATGKLTHARTCVWIDPAEFEQRARELGWINGYKWGKEYPANGKTPDLLGDVEVEVDGYNSGQWLQPRRVKSNQWQLTNKFRIVDERYKPADTSYLTDENNFKPSWDCAPNNANYLIQTENGRWHWCVDVQLDSPSGLVMIGVNDAGNGRPNPNWRDTLEKRPDCYAPTQTKNLTHGEKGLTHSDWHERGEFPPAGTECEVMFDGDWYKTLIIGMNGEFCVYVSEGFESFSYNGDNNPENFRPIKTEREKFVDAATAVFYNGSHCERMAEALYDAGFRAPE